MSTSYLVIRPLSEDPSEFEHLFQDISRITSLDVNAIRQRTTGTSLKILLNATAEGKDKHDEMAAALKRIGIPAVVISKEEIRATKKPVRITGVEVADKSLRLTSRGGKEVLKLDGKRQCLIVLTTREHNRLHSKRLTRRSLAADEPITTLETLKFIFTNNPVMDIYVSGIASPLRIDGSRFNFTSLRTLNKGTTAQNIPVLLKEIRKQSTSAILDTGLGDSELPFINLSEVSKEHHFLDAFSQYSRFVFLAASRGIFSRKDAKEKNAGFEVLAGLGGMLLAGPVMVADALAQGAMHNATAPLELLTGTFGAQAQGTGEAISQDPTPIAPIRKAPGPKVEKKKTPLLPSPPMQPVKYSYRRLGSWHNKIRIGLHRYKRYVKQLGPPVIFYPLTIITVASLWLAQATGITATLFITFLSTSLILFCHSFILLQRKRAIENCPTSNIGTMPMGTVEVRGRAKPKYYMRAPFSLTECVYYSYKVYKRIQTTDGHYMKLIETAHSGVVPFFVEDDTGRTLVLPQEAVIHAGNKQSFNDNPLRIIGASKAVSYKNRWVVEKVIAVGTPLYILGFAHRTIHSGKEKKKQMNERLSEIKSDPLRMRKYDKDMDGKISMEEWEEARREMEERILLENMESRDPSENIAIGDHPGGGLFYISGKHEDAIITSMSWKIPVFLVSGIIGITVGIFYTYNLITNSVFQAAIKSLIW